MVKILANLNFIRDLAEIHSTDLVRHNIESNKKIETNFILILFNILKFDNAPSTLFCLFVNKCKQAERQFRRISAQYRHHITGGRSENYIRILIKSSMDKKKKDLRLFIRVCKFQMESRIIVFSRAA